MNGPDSHPTSRADARGSGRLDAVRPTRRQLLATLAGGTLALAGCLGDDDGDDDDSGEIPDDIDPGLVLNGLVLDSAFPVQLAEAETDRVLADVHYHPTFRHWHQLPVSVPEGEWRQLRAVVTDHAGERVPLGPDGDLTIEMEPDADTARDLLDIEIDGEFLNLYGDRRGTGEYDFYLVDDGERVWEAPALAVRVE